jgi:hypothetical protein
MTQQKGDKGNVINLPTLDHPAHPSPYYRAGVAVAVVQEYPVLASR